LGQGADVSNSWYPNLVKGPLYLIEITDIACGWQHSMAITKNGFVYSWGINLNGQLGIGDFQDRNIPTLIKDLLIT